MERHGWIGSEWEVGPLWSGRGAGAGLAGWGAAPCWAAARALSPGASPHRVVGGQVPGTQEPESCGTSQEAEAQDLGGAQSRGSITRDPPPTRSVTQVCQGPGHPGQCPHSVIQRWYARPMVLNPWWEDVEDVSHWETQGTRQDPRGGPLAQQALAAPQLWEQRGAGASGGL